jgi:hypothetical protein
MTERAWWVVGTLSGVRCEEHLWEPDNALSGPYKSGDIAAIAMRRMVERDRWEMLIARLVVGGFVALSLVMAGWWVIGRVV